jgi:hypothetical protein
MMDIASICYDGSGKACWAVGALVGKQDRKQPIPDLCDAALQALRANM